MKWFNKKDIVNCIDALSGEAVMSRNESNYLNLVFIGDSRVRQIFFDFVKVFDCLLKNALLSYEPLIFLKFLLSYNLRYCLYR